MTLARSPFHRPSRPRLKAWLPFDSRFMSESDDDLAFYGIAPHVDPATASAPAPAQQADPKYPQYIKGTMVLLLGLTSDTDKNGRSGVIVGFDGASGRWLVQMADRQFKVRPECVQLHPYQKQKDAEPR